VEIGIKQSIGGETLDECWMSNSHTSEHEPKKKKKKAELDGVHTELIAKSPATKTKLRTMGSGAG
jgi:hypothetical protein